MPQQLTLRIPSRLAAELKRAATASGRSVNAYATAVLEAAVDPDLAGSEAERVRERLARAGLLAAPTRGKRTRPDPAKVRKAAAAAGRGTSLADLVSDGR